jgi:probable phosphoglycerate mutase
MPSLSGMSAELWLIRHGESIGNRDNLYQGQNDLPLSAGGHRQVALLAERLAALHPIHSFSALYSSDLERSIQTATPCAQTLGLPIRLNAGLREIDVGTWSGLTFDDIQGRFPEEWTASYPVMDPDLIRGGGESYRQAQRRVVAALCGIVKNHPGERVLVYFHGGVLQTVLTHVMQLPLPNKRFLHTANTSISRVRLTTSDDSLNGQVLGMNDVAHLERTGQALASVGPE